MITKSKSALSVDSLAQYGIMPDISKAVQRLLPPSVPSVTIQLTTPGT